MRSMSSPQTGGLCFRSAFRQRAAVIGRRVAACGVGLAVLALLVPRASGSVDTNPGDDVIPTDNPFTTMWEGLPTDGHKIQRFRDPTSAAQEDYVDGEGFEGRYDVVVGKSGTGTVTISGGSQIRAEHLILGDSEMPALTVYPFRDFASPYEEPSAYTGIRGVDLRGDGTGRHGTGVMRIDGNGSLYNNDYTILPPALQPPVIANFGSVRQPDSDTKVGLDAYIGRWGNGRLEIVAGGRAEIEDAFIVGDWSSGVGYVVVDGTDSSLTSGGFDISTVTTGGTSANDDDDQVHYFSVGRRGTGTVDILNGAQVFSRGPTTTGNPTSVTAAVIGGNEYVVDTSASGTTPPDPGGSGIVNVDGAGSTWTLGGSLQVGGFHFIQQQSGDEDVEGDNVHYPSTVGSGTLTVSNGGLVSIVPPEGLTTNEIDVDRFMLVGRQGTVNLQGGRIELVQGFQLDDPTTPLPNSRRRLFNDGRIGGSGTIDTGTFDNRYYGLIHLDGGETLQINANTTNTGSSDPPPFANYGLIEVFGTQYATAELDFSWESSETSDPLVSFINRPVATTTATAPTTFDGGLISARWATLRFSSGYIADPSAGVVAPVGMRNEGVMAFTAGINTIQGFVLNAQDPDADPGNPPLDPKFIIGPDTTVVVEDDFAVAPPAVLDLGVGSHLIILDQSTMWLAGQTNLSLGTAGDSPISVAGDLVVGGSLNVSLANDLLYSLTNGSTFEILSFSGTAYHADTSDPNYYVKVGDALLPGAQGFESLTTNADLLYPNLDAIARMIGNGIYLTFLDASAIGAMGADFDGNGIVDLADLTIWRANFGITDGASVLQGDADGDGDVDGDDFLIWQQKFGGPPGAGSGAFASNSLVPEPASATLLVTGAMLALAAVRRRRRTTC